MPHAQERVVAVFSVPDGKDRSERAVDVDVRRPIHGVEEDRVAACFRAAGIEKRLLHLFRSRERDEAPIVESFQKNLVCQNVQLLLFLSLYVRRVRRAELPLETCDCQLAGDLLARKAEPHQKLRELTGRRWMRLLGLEDE